MNNDDADELTKGPNDSLCTGTTTALTSSPNKNMAAQQPKKYTKPTGKITKDAGKQKVKFR